MKIYISGMITGLKHDQYRKKFKEAVEFLRSEGNDPVDPSELGKPEHHSWDYYMRKAIPQLCECDGIYMLEGWQESKGARLELQIARSLDMNVVEQSMEDNLDEGNYGQGEL
tara:strand:+ start:1611 stop:1946 length:336 start_codon:yes stop_codon:yes gene_type:complete